MDFAWAYNYILFLDQHGLNHFDTRQFRLTGLEIVHQITGGDLRAMQAWANHKRVGTTPRNYVSDGAKQRDEERLAEIMQVRGRWRRTRGKIETRGRPEHTDIRHHHTRLDVSGSVFWSLRARGYVVFSLRPVPRLPAGEHRLAIALRLCPGS